VCYDVLVTFLEHTVEFFVALQMLKRSQVNFINVLRPAFASADLKSTKRYR